MVVDSSEMRRFELLDVPSLYEGDGSGWTAFVSE